jgi:hypothetical protein
MHTLYLGSAESTLKLLLLLLLGLLCLLFLTELLLLLLLSCSVINGVLIMPNKTTMRKTTSHYSHSSGLTSTLSWWRFFFIPHKACSWCSHTHKLRIKRNHEKKILGSIHHTETTRLKQAATFLSHTRLAVYFVYTWEPGNCITTP